MSETLDLRNLTQEQKEKLPQDVRMALRERTNGPAREKARQILADESPRQQPLSTTQMQQKDEPKSAPKTLIKKRKLPQKKSEELSQQNTLPKKPVPQNLPSTPQKKPISPLGSTKSKKKFTVQITERLMREFKIEALRKGLTYSELAERAFTNILFSQSRPQNTLEDT